MAVDIINEETDAIIRRALKYRKGSDDAYVQPWPGTAFVVNGDNEAMVLLGTFKAWQWFQSQSYLTMLHRLSKRHRCRLLPRTT
jgi:hypothetical protein